MKKWLPSSHFLLSIAVSIVLLPGIAFSYSVKEQYEKLKSFNAMRESLAMSISPDKPITEKTFQTTCMPVGAALKAWANEKGYSARQIATKYRNPNNAPTPDEIKTLEMFDKNPKLLENSIVGKFGTQLYVRIPVVQSCLYCHGPKDKRPDFIKKKYPKDLAYDFRVGDLRGLYAVSIPHKKK